LRQAGRAHLGRLDLAVATRLLSAPDRITTICAFARQVSAAADPRVDPGVDPVADAILDDAAADLISSVLAAARRSGTTAVVFRGGLLDSPGYRSKINRAAIAAGLEVREAQQDVLAVEHDRLLLPPYRENAVALVIP
jgi:N-acetylglucosamine kinase-like BadF-type ATPase